MSFGDPTLDIEGPVRGEVFVLYQQGGNLFLSGPDGPHAWLIETHGRENPMEEIRRIATELLAGLRLLHSTSWRWEGSAVVLSFVAVVDAPESMRGIAVPQRGQVGLARGTATASPASVSWDQVLEHAIRHLAWLAQEDEVVRLELDDGWQRALSGYIPATFQQVG